MREASPWVMVFCLFGTGLLLLFWAQTRDQKTGNPYIGFQSVLMTVFFIHYAVGGMIMLFWDFLPWTSAVNQQAFSMHGEKWHISFAAYLALLGGLGLFCGSRIEIRSRKPSEARNRREINRLKKVAPFFLITSLVLLAVVAPYIPTTWQHVFIVLGGFGPVLLGFCAYIAASRRDPWQRTSWWLLCVIGCGLLMLPGVGTGERVDFIRPLVFVLVGFIAARKRIPWRLCILSFLLFVFVALPILNVAKQYAQAGRGSGLDRMHEAVVDVQNNKSGKLENVLSNLLLRIGLLSSAAIYPQYYPDQFPWLLGESFKLELLDFVPRPLWPDKPEVGPMIDGYAREVGIIGLWDVKSSAKFDAISEYYVNFGAIGVFVLAWCHGVFYRLLDTGFRRFMSPLLATLSMAVIFLQNPDFVGFILLSSSHLQQLAWWSTIVACVRADPLRSRPRATALDGAPGMIRLNVAPREAGI